MNTLGLLGVGSHLTVGSSHLVEGKFLHLLESQLTGLLFRWKWLRKGKEN
mgnify:CR=1 FL=1